MGTQQSNEPSLKNSHSSTTTKPTRPNVEAPEWPNKEDSPGLTVTVHEAKGLPLPGKLKGGLSPMVLLSCSFNPQTFKTKVLKNAGESPTWGATFKFISSKPEGLVRLEFFHKSLDKGCLGEVEIKVGPQDFKKSGTVDGWHNILPPSHKKAAPNLQSDQQEPSKVRVSLECDWNWESEEKPQRQLGPTQDISIYYDVGKILGTGMSAQVHQATDKETAREVAIKIIDKEGADADISLIQREIDIMQILNHPNIIKLYECFSNAKTIYLVEELLDGGELFDLLIERGNLTTDEASGVLKQVLSGIAYMHYHGIAHRDLKPENLLVDIGRTVIKITDFGASKSFSGDSAMMTMVGSPLYVAPEILLSQPYDQAVDIWSIGVITYMMLCGWTPFQTANNQPEQQIFANILSGQFSFPSPEWDAIPDECKDFIKQILVLEPSARPSARQLQKHPWLAQNSLPRRVNSNIHGNTFDRLKDFQIQRKASSRKAISRKNTVDSVTNNNVTTTNTTNTTNTNG